MSESFVLSALVLSVLTVACDVLEMGMLKKVGGMATDEKRRERARDSSAHWMDVGRVGWLIVCSSAAAAADRSC